MTRRALAVMILSVVGVSGERIAAGATFVNLSDKDVFVARCDYEAGSTQPDVTPARYRCSGWKKLAPGGVLRVSGAAWLHFQQAGKPLAWKNRKTIPGVVKSSFPRSGVVVPRNARKADFDKLAQAGFQKVDYAGFGDGVFQIAGTAFAVKRFQGDFSHESRSLQFVNKAFRPGGAVVSHSVAYSENKWSNVKWGIQNDGLGVYYGGSIQGKQVRIGGPREPAKFKGRVTVDYVARR